MSTYWRIHNDIQRSNVLNHIRGWDYPFDIKVTPPARPKTLSQVRYAHSLCNALAIARGAPLPAAKKDCKVAFGVTVVSTSLVSGTRTARLTSFADYKRDEMIAFCTAMEAFLSEEGIPFTASEE